MINGPDQSSPKIINNPPTSKVWISLLMLLMVVIGMVISTKVQQIPLVQTGDGYLSDQRISIYEESKVEILLSCIETRYGSEMDHDKLVEKAIHAILGELGPYSNYLSAKQLQGKFGVLEIDILTVDDTTFFNQM